MFDHPWLMMSRSTIIGNIPGLEEINESDVRSSEKVSVVEDVAPLKAKHSEKTTLNAEEAQTKSRRKILRAAGGEIWEDPTLSDWNPTHFRIFVGDLSRQVTDVMLFQAFSSLFPSTSKARVVRDKHTGRSKGFGFVAMSDEVEFRRAMREMHGKYIGDRPVKLKKSNWRERSVDDPEQVSALKQLGYRINKPSFS